jgi:O-Antigen ligase
VVRAALLPRLTTPAAVLAVVGANLFVALAVARWGWGPAVGVGLVPLVVIAFGALVAADRSVLVFGALALGMVPALLKDPLPLQASTSVYAGDILVLLAAAAWIAELLVRGPSETLRRWPRTALGWPFVLFAAATLAAVMRGHVAYGTTLLGQPVRLFLYAAIAFAMVGLDSKRLYRGIVVVFYAGTMWMFAYALHAVATGTTHTQSSNLSTGGTRILAISVSFYLASALFLALLNLEIDASATRRALHLAVAALALGGIALAFGRGTFAVVGVAAPLLLLGFRRIRASVIGFLPLCLPFIVLAAIFIPRAVPDFGTTFVNRVNLHPRNDLSLRWRQEANQAVWRQVQESPLVGVGFGRTSTFTLQETGASFTIEQNPHNSYVYLLAGGGILLLGSFLLLCLAYAVDAWRALRDAKEPHERVLIIWSAFTLFAFLVNAVAEPLFSWSTILLTIWILMLIPSVVRSQGRHT